MRDPEDSAKSARNPPRLVTQDGVLVGKELIGGGGGGRPPTDRGRGEPDILDIRSDVELARLLVADLRADLGEVHWCEGRLSSYCGTHWIAYPEHLLRLAAHRYHGSHFFKPGRQRAEVVLLGKTRINSIISELAAMLAAPDFFGEWPDGINCESGLVRIDADGAAQLEQHHPDHRCRHVLRGHWVPPSPARTAWHHRPTVCSLDTHMADLRMIPTRRTRSICSLKPWGRGLPASPPAWPGQKP